MARAKKIIVGNWKMNPASADEAKTITRTVIKFIRQGALQRNPTPVDAVLCPPFVYIDQVAQLIMAEKKKKSAKAGSKLFLGAQNCSAEPLGAQTGEISGAFLGQFGTQYVILGHSERRALGETDEMVNKKVGAALGWKLKPIICIGERTRDDDGEYLNVIKNQVEKALLNVPRESLNAITIAYEPVWAIGATAAMKPGDVHETILFIRKVLFELYKVRTVNVPILYGGSVDAENAQAILTTGEASGLLIGRQSLDAKNFTAILAMAATLT